MHPCGSAGIRCAAAFLRASARRRFAFPSSSPPQQKPGIQRMSGFVVRFFDGLGGGVSPSFLR
jgi:hypothetical protein